ncbi:MAG TPA: hypothetical protein VF373_12040 [Prolixibacteraceae bacterium]
MKDKRRGLFSLSVKDSEYFKDKEDKIEFVSCVRLGKDCKEHRSVINKNYHESRKFLLNKDYPRSIEALKNAYYMTSDLQDSACSKCAELFRETITQSLEIIHEDLEKLSGSLFRGKQYQYSYGLATNVLREFKKES